MAIKLLQFLGSSFYFLTNPFVAFTNKYERGNWNDAKLRDHISHVFVVATSTLAPIWTITWIVGFFVIPLPALCLWAIGVPILGFVLNIMFFA